MSKKKTTQKQSVKIPKFIKQFSKIITIISPKLSILFIARLFSTPIKHKIPKREMEMDRKSSQTLVFIPELNKKVMVYHYGVSERKVLLVHGWSGRGTQLYKIADELQKIGFSTISFDAPAHSKSPGMTTIMPEFVATILELEKQFGTFEFAIGHSLGSMSLLHSVKKGLTINRLVVIGSGDVVQDIFDDFISKLELKPSTSEQLRIHFEKKHNEEMDNYSAYKSAMEISIPVLVIHDKNDDDVPVKAGINIHKHLEKGELILTEGLGHRKILGNSTVIEAIIQFIEKHK